MVAAYLFGTMYSVFAITKFLIQKLAGD